MNARNILGMSIATGVCAVLCGCGGSSHNSASTPSPMPPTGTTVQTFTPNLVENLALSTSDTSDPIAVKGGNVVLTPADDETSDPMAISH